MIVVKLLEECLLIFHDSSLQTTDRNKALIQTIICRKMKPIFAQILIISSVFILTSGYDMARLAPIYESCKAQFSSIQKFPTIQEMTAISFETGDPQIKCFIHCLGETAGEVDASGILVVNGLKNMGWGDEAKITTAVNGCIGIKGIDKCDTSYQQYGCFMMKMM